MLEHDPPAAARDAGACAEGETNIQDDAGLELAVVRHGETDLNAVGSFQGQVDPPLNARGHEQARALAERLRGERFDALVCSDLLRARQTARPLAEVLGLDVMLEPLLREQAFGAIDGLPVAEVQARLPQVWARFVQFVPDEAVADGAESYAAFAQRVGRALEHLARRHPRPGARLLVVAHGGVLDVLYRRALGLPLAGPRRCPIPHTGVNRLTLAPGGRLAIRRWAEIPPEPAAG
jgi:probable phosphoglycerate mutase